MARSQAHASRILSLRKNVNIYATIAINNGCTDIYIGTINCRNKEERMADALKPLRQVMKPFLGDRPFIIIGVDIPAVSFGTKHDRQHHGHFFLFAPPGAESYIKQATDMRNSSVLRSYQIRRPDDARGGVSGWLGYMECRRNAGHSESELYLSKVACLGDYTQGLCEMWGEGETQGFALFGGQFKTLVYPKTSYADRGNSGIPSTDTATIARVAGHTAIVSPPGVVDWSTGEVISGTALGASTTSAEAFDAETREVIESKAVGTDTGNTIRIPTQKTPDLLGYQNTISVPRSVLDGWENGVMPEPARHAVTAAIADRRTNQDGLAGIIGISQAHLSLVLNGKRPMGAKAVSRLKAWLLSAQATPRQSRKASQGGHRSDPRQLTMLGLLAA